MDRLQGSLSRLSSGSRLISPQDDAASLAVSIRFRAQNNRYNCIHQNLANAISIQQTQDGYLSNIAKTLDRMSTLATLARDGTKSLLDRRLYAKEFLALNDSLAITKGQKFNGVNIFSNTSANELFSVNQQDDDLVSDQLTLTKTCLDLTTSTYINNFPTGAAATNSNSLVNSTGSVNSVNSSQNSTAAWGLNNFGQINLPNGIANVLTIAAGNEHSIALKSDGTVIGWGRSSEGQVTIPIGLTGVKSITAGGYFSAALKTDGTVIAWGQSSYGQLNIPQNLTNVSQIDAGSGNVLALKNDGTVVGWGSNNFGQSAVPAGLNGVVAVAAGWAHCLALKSDGTVVGWGNNSYNQATVPVGLTGVIAIAAGEHHSLALKSDGTVVAWGSNADGQTNVPAGLTGVTKIAAADGGNYSLALKSDGTIVAWGGNDSGQTNVPQQLTSVVEIAAGYRHGLALTGGSNTANPSSGGGSTTTGNSNSSSGSLTGSSANSDASNIFDDIASVDLIAERVKDDINTIAIHRSTIGSELSRLFITQDGIQSLNENLDKAASTLTDVNIAKESTVFQKQKILSEMSLTVIQQANQIPQYALRLLQNI